MKTVACVIDEGFAPFEFGVVCEVFGLDRRDDGIPGFDFHVVAPDPGAVRSKLGFSVNVDEDLSFAYTADLVIFCPPLRESCQSSGARRARGFGRAAGAAPLSCSSSVDPGSPIPWRTRMSSISAASASSFAKCPAG